MVKLQNRTAILSARVIEGIFSIPVVEWWYACIDGLELVSKFWRMGEVGGMVKLDIPSNLNKVKDRELVIFRA